LSAGSAGPVHFQLAKRCRILTARALRHHSGPLGDAKPS
jgi:hypothetical protein